MPHRGERSFDGVQEWMKWTAGLEFAALTLGIWFTGLCMTKIYTVVNDLPAYKYNFMNATFGFLGSSLAALACVAIALESYFNRNNMLFHFDTICIALSIAMVIIQETGIRLQYTFGFSQAIDMYDIEGSYMFYSTVFILIALNIYHAMTYLMDYTPSTAQPQPESGEMQSLIKPAKTNFRELEAHIPIK